MGTGRQGRTIADHRIRIQKGIGIKNKIRQTQEKQASLNCGYGKAMNWNVD